MGDELGAEYDIAIIGARVAGASLALLLGQRDRRVLLLDRAHFPSGTLSTHYMAPPAVALLARLGILADVESAGFRRLTRSRTYWLADALDATLRDAAWDDALGEFKRKCDATLLPTFRATLAFAQEPNVPSAGLAWLRAAFPNPSFARTMAAGLPAVISAAFPEPLRPRIARIAQSFGAPPPPAPPS